MAQLQTAQERFKASPVAYLDSLGFLGPGVLGAHGVWVNDADIAILKARGVGVSHNPESNMKLASGTAPVPAYLRAETTGGRRMINPKPVMAIVFRAMLVACVWSVGCNFTLAASAADGADGTGKLAAIARAYRAYAVATRTCTAS